MYYQCLKCERSFDAESAPDACPFCKTEGRIAIISDVDEDGNELTYAEHIKSLREYYLAHLPHGMSRSDITAMTDQELEEMDDILSE
ncbi:MAG: hypothetical protein IJ058_14415 [Lachnospiraceae bacterium]|nr:hypothetical protein [Lachnospiraceae bacterium]MBQ8947975.1 hypothetical protein [Lachnospiraceae bacterium]